MASPRVMVGRDHDPGWRQWHSSATAGTVRRHRATRAERGRGGAAMTRWRRRCADAEGTQYEPRLSAPRGWARAAYDAVVRAGMLGFRDA